MNKQRKGFTLIELLVVVLIIGILAAVAVPQYQKAVLKSRFSSLMPVVKAVAEGQEVYYLANDEYADDDHISDLDITVPDGGAETIIQVGNEDEPQFKYVMGKKRDLPGLAYIIYQKHSPSFSDTIMCEAKIDDELATWVCKEAFNGTEVTSGSLQKNGWTAYLLKGKEGSGTFERINVITNTSQCTTDICSLVGSWIGSNINEILRLGAAHVVEYYPNGDASMCIMPSLGTFINNISCLRYDPGAGVLDAVAVSADGTIEGAMRYSVPIEDLYSFNFSGGEALDLSGTSIYAAYPNMWPDAWPEL